MTKNTGSDMLLEKLMVISTQLERATTKIEWVESTLKQHCKDIKGMTFKIEEMERKFLKQETAFKLFSKFRFPELVMALGLLGIGAGGFDLIEHAKVNIENKKAAQIAGRS